MILGIDPGVQHLGLAYLDPSTVQIIRHEEYKWQESYQRLLETMLVNLEGVVAVSIEKPFFSPMTLAKNIRTLEVIGIIKLAVEIKNSALKEPITITEYSPSSIKKTYTGNGRAEKKDIIRETQQRFNLTIKNTHEADAVAIAYKYYVECIELYN